jgi:hypothetical protein
MQEISREPLYPDALKELAWAVSQHPRRHCPAVPTPRGESASESAVPETSQASARLLLDLTFPSLTHKVSPLSHLRHKGLCLLSKARITKPNTYPGETMSGDALITNLLAVHARTPPDIPSIQHPSAVMESDPIVNALPGSKKPNPFPPIQAGVDASRSTFKRRQS